MSNGKVIDHSAEVALYKRSCSLPLILQSQRGMRIPWDTRRKVGKPVSTAAREARMTMNVLLELYQTEEPTSNVHQRIITEAQTFKGVKDIYDETDG